jgi:hypothetical protein
MDFQLTNFFGEFFMIFSLSDPCRGSKDSEQSFYILTQHVTIVSVALVRRINLTIYMVSEDGLSFRRILR